MNSFRPILGARIFWLFFGGTTGTISLSQGLRAGVLGQGLIGLGMVMMGCAWFMRPLQLGARISSNAEGRLRQLKETAEVERLAK